MAGERATEVRVRKANRSAFVSGRPQAAFPCGTGIPDYYCMDGTIPRKALSRVLIAIADCRKSTGCAA